MKPNMNLSMNLSLDPKQLMPVFRGAIRPLTIMVALGLIGYTGYQISRVTSIQPDIAYMETNRQNHKTPSLKINQDTLRQLKSLVPAGDTSIPVEAGKNDPFQL